MFGHLSKSCILFYCVLLSMFLSANVNADKISEKSLDKILQGSGLAAQIEQFPELIKVGMEEARGQEGALPAFAYDLILASIDQTILASDILSGIRSSLRDEISQDEANELIKWYGSPLGKKISEAETKAANPEVYNEIAATEEQLLKDTQRLESAKRFDDLLNATAMNTDIQKHTSIAIFSAVMTAREPDKEVDVAPFSAYLDSVAEQTKETIYKDILLSFIYSYKDIPLDELTVYEKFLNKKPSKNFNRVIVESMSREIENSITKWATSLTSILKRKGAAAI